MQINDDDDDDDDHHRRSFRGGGLEGLILRKKIIKIVANRCHVLKV